jgi:hypothetical protein
MPKLIQKNKYQDEFSFLYDLINDFTKKLDINNKLFYFMVQREIKGTQLLQGFVYSKEGLSSDKEMVKLYKKEKEIYGVAPYLASFSRLLSYVYQKASSKVGEEKAEHLLEESFDNLKKKYSVEPNLEGYVPRKAIGKAAAAAAAAAFDVSLMDNMLNYLLNDIIKKGITPAQKKIEEGKKEEKKLSPEELRNAIRRIYLQALGPLGGKKYDQINQSVDCLEIKKQIESFRNKGIINADRMNLILQSVRNILNVEENHDYKNEVKKLYVATFGAIGEDLFREIENDLNVENVLKHVEELAKKGILNGKEADELSDRVKTVFGT